jgi:methanogenic corrinoid protein MtbC1
VVARRTGLSPDVLRAWERRYKAVTPERSDKNRRLYSDEDIERLRLLRRVTSAGRRIGDVSRLSRGELEALAAADEAEQVAEPTPPQLLRRETQGYFEAAMRAVDGLDAAALESALSSAAVGLSVPALIDEFLTPLMREVGDRWRAGSLRVAQEHLASACVRSFLSKLTAAESHGGDVLVTTPLGQHHELGALTVAVAVALDGWNVTYLGPNLPAEEIVAAARQRAARAVLLSIVFPTDDPRLAGELSRIKRMLGDEVRVVVGGSGAESYRDVLAELALPLIDDIAGLRTSLDELR